MEQNANEINGGISISVDMSVKNTINVIKDYVWNPVTINCKNGTC